MLPIKSELCSIKSFSKCSNGVFDEHSETFEELKLSNALSFGVENTEYDDANDFGIHVSFPEGSTAIDYTNSKVLKVCLTANHEWRHTDDDQVVHIAVHTTSGILKVAMFHEHGVSTPLRKIVLKSPHLNFTDFI